MPQLGVNSVQDRVVFGRPLAVSVRDGPAWDRGAAADVPLKCVAQAQPSARQREYNRDDFPEPGAGRPAGQCQRAAFAAALRGGFRSRSRIRAYSVLPACSRQPR